MQTLKQSHLVLAAIWVAGSIVTLVAAVPAWMSLSTFWWANAAIAGLTAVLVTSVRSAGPTRSIAHVLYDTEHQGSPRR